MSQLPDDVLVGSPAAERTRRTVLGATWLLTVAFLVGVPAVYLASNTLDADYKAEGTLWIDDASRQVPDDGTPVQAAGSPARSAWIELLRSHQVLDPVVVEQRLYVRFPEDYAPAFASFTVAERFAPGTYELRAGDTGEDFVLANEQGSVVQQGVFGSPIGQELGFIWTPSRTAFAPGATVTFSVLNPRDVSRELSTRLVAAMDPAGGFLRVALEGPDGQATTDVLNAVMERYVALAGELKRAKLAETLALLEGDAQAAEFALAQAERELEEFRAGTLVASSDPQPGAEPTDEEARLERQVQTMESLYREVRGRVATVQIAEASAVPDVRVLDGASITGSHGNGFLLLRVAMILAASLVVMAGGALLLNRMAAADTEAS